MIIQHLHNWNLIPKEAIALQKELAHHIITDDCLHTVTYIAGVDVALSEKNCHAAIVIMTYPDLNIIDLLISLHLNMIYVFYEYFV